MKKHFSTRGYLRTVLLSVMAAFAIECMVNADEVKDAFLAGQQLKQSTTASIQSSTEDFLRVPQKISNIIGRICKALNE